MLQPFLREFVLAGLTEAESDGRRPQLMIAGCGNSRLGCDMYDDYVGDDGEPRIGIWNVDYASTAVANSRAAAGERKMQHVVADLCRLQCNEFPDGIFDFVVDKGAVDALCCAGADSVKEVARQLLRVVRPEGRVIVVSGVALPELVLEAFSDWDVILDGSTYITEDGDATINLGAHLFVFERPDVRDVLKD